MKIKTALILCAGYGKALKSNNTDNPKASTKDKRNNFIRKLY